MRFRIRLQRAQDHRGKVFGAVLRLAQGERFFRAHMALEPRNRRLWMGQQAPPRRLAGQQRAVIAHPDDRWGQRRAVHVGDELGRAVFKRRDQRVRRAQINADGSHGRAYRAFRKSASCVNTENKCSYRRAARASLWKIDQVKPKPTDPVRSARCSGLSAFAAPA